MTANEILTDFSQRLAREMPEIKQRRVYSGERTSYGIAAPVLTGEVAEERWEGGAWKAKLSFTLYLPENIGLQNGEEICSAIASMAREEYPLLSSAVRSGTGRDKTTGLMTLGLALNFAAEGGGSQGVHTVILGGVEYQAAGWKTTMAMKGDNLVSIGEEEPFAVINGSTEYTVELTGIQVEGLERLTGFTVSLGDGEVYENCRWKSLFPGDKKAVFVSAYRQKAE